MCAALFCSPQWMVLHEVAHGQYIMLGGYMLYYSTEAGIAGQEKTDAGIT
jgi:hypothetical protein